jgi:hypothetical protein
MPKSPLLYSVDFAATFEGAKMGPYHNILAPSHLQPAAEHVKVLKLVVSPARAREAQP